MTTVHDGAFIFGNACTALHLALEDGVLYCGGIEDLRGGTFFGGGGRRVPSFSLPGVNLRGAAVDCERVRDDRGGLSAEAEELRIRFAKDGRSLTLTLRAYAENPFIRAELSLDGVFGQPAEERAAELESGIETAQKKPAAPQAEVIFRCPIDEKHLKVRTVTLTDVTDANNILVSEQTTTVYPRRAYETKGQLFFVDAYLRGQMLMLVKEAPCVAARVADGAYDLRVEPASAVLMGGIGADFSREAAYTPDVPLYAVSFAPGSDAGELERAWRGFYRLDMARTLAGGVPSMSNTWGDRSQDSAVCESFMLGEISRARKLGVQTVQIDDGWQKGLTANSRFAGTKVWGHGYYELDPDFWTPHPERFPRGLAPVIRAMEEAQLLPGLWFSPDLENDYESWERDAETLLGLHRAFGIRFFKLDGIDLASKQMETNLYAMIRRVHRHSEGRVSFNFDITARRRWGYLFRREFGNLFVENRYTDWGNYHPHSTLRTLWMLCRYIPAARLQMEFLNLRRNPQNYEGDPLAPDLYGIDWAYAAVMFACPLYWMEMTHLSDADAAVLAEIAAVRNSIADELAQADVTPVGDEPDGIAFTGLRADCGDHGYLLLFRENSPEAEHSFAIPALAGRRLTRLAGTADAAPCGNAVHFTAAAPRSFGLYRYE